MKKSKIDAIVSWVLSMPKSEGNHLSPDEVVIFIEDRNKLKPESCALIEKHYRSCKECTEVLRRVWEAKGWDLEMEELIRSAPVRAMFKK